jgi:hypothetical protein
MITKYKQYSLIHYRRIPDGHASRLTRINRPIGRLVNLEEMLR